MTSRGKPSVLPCLMVVLLAFCARLSGAYEIETHGAITLQAVLKSNIDVVLRQDLGLRDGRREVVRGQRAEDWIAIGSAREDDVARFFMHFHDPLLPWNRSGLGFGQISRQESSIVWGQDDSQSWAWPKVRQYYIQALTASSSGEREQAFADTFRGLGQVIHLIQDAASPGHTRNDSHPWYNYETLVQDVQREEGPVFASWLALSRDPNPGWARMPSDPLAPAPIARLLDTDQYTGTNPQISTGPLIGLSEYTNANFFSEDRTFPEDTFPLFRYPYPARSSVREADFRITLRTSKEVTRQYFLKVADGDTGYRLATVGFLRAYLQRYNLDPARFRHIRALDESVYKDYAARLVPRAVGYSKALLDYFFRGKLDFEVHPSFETAGRMELTFSNKSAETMTGSFTLYTDDKEGKRVPVPGVSIEGLTLSGTDGDLTSSHTMTFTPDPAVKLRGLTLVFSGTLGAEEGAVAGKVKPWEPPIFVIQEFAELTGPEQVETKDWCLDPETGEVCWWYSINSATNTRSKDPRMQRAGGTFLAADGSDAGEFIKRIVLETFAPPPADRGIVLRLNGETVAGREWSREKGPALVPKKWEIVVDLTQLPESYGLIGLPMLLVETQSGTQQWTAPVWWMQNKAVGEAWHGYCYGCCQSSVLVVSSTSAWNEVVVSFGGDFIPVEGIGGFEVGTYTSTGGLTDSPEACPVEESTSDKYVALFVDQFHTPTNRAAVSQGQSARRWVEESDRNAYARPPGPPPRAPQLVQELRFRRQYSPYEVQFYQRLGITPPEYEIELR